MGSYISLFLTYLLVFVFDKTTLVTFHFTPGLFLMVSNTSGHLEQFADALRVTMQPPCNL
jgi:hypothetical protein